MRAGRTGGWGRPYWPCESCPVRETLWGEILRSLPTSNHPVGPAIRRDAAEPRNRQPAAGLRWLEDGGGERGGGDGRTLEANDRRQPENGKREKDRTGLLGRKKRGEC